MMTCCCSDQIAVGCVFLPHVGPEPQADSEALSGRKLAGGSGSAWRISWRERPHVVNAGPDEKAAFGPRDSVLRVSEEKAAEEKEESGPGGAALRGQRLRAVQVRPRLFTLLEVVYLQS